jgi:hypothetical protein
MFLLINSQAIKGHRLGEGTTLKANNTKNLPRPVKMVWAKINSPKTLRRCCDRPESVTTYRVLEGLA